MAPIYKGKNDAEICDNARGILLADHSGKALVGRIKNAVEEQYNSGVPLSQYGAVCGRGTDFATHVVRTLASIAERENWSIFSLFLDLVKAFDRVNR